MRSNPRLLPLVLGATLACATALPAQSWLPTSLYPTWATSGPGTTIQHVYDTGLDAEANGALLQTAIGNLQPGQGLAVAPGTYSIRGRFDISKSASAAAPIWVFAANPAQRPIITRPDGNQNTVNLGSNAPLRYLVLQNLEITGGADLVRMYDCENVWIDGCYVHDGGGIGIAAQTLNTQFLYITRNEVARPGPGTNGEALYLGGNFGSVICSWSIVALNHVHDTRSGVPGQGDGIELKQGSHHNWVVGNYVHDTKNPCLLVYGTGGVGENVVENNVLWDSDDAVLQVQGDAIVRNNIAVSGGVAFSSHDHQGSCQNLTFVHNTLVNAGRCFEVTNWAGRPNMVFANNVAYSMNAEALYFGTGSAGITLAGNVISGTTKNVTEGFVFGKGASDFTSLNLAALSFDLTPTVGGGIDNRGLAAFAVPVDQQARVRSLPVDPGALGNRDTLTADIAGWPVLQGGQQTLRYSGAVNQAGLGYWVLGSISGATPGIAFGGFEVPLAPDAWFMFTAMNPNTPATQTTAGNLDATAAMTAKIVLPPLGTVLSGTVVRHAVTLWGGDGSLSYVSNPATLTLR